MEDGGQGDMKRRPLNSEIQRDNWELISYWILLRPLPSGTEVVGAHKATGEPLNSINIKRTTKDHRARSKKQKDGKQTAPSHFDDDQLITFWRSRTSRSIHGLLIHHLSIEHSSLTGKWLPTAWNVSPGGRSRWAELLRPGLPKTNVNKKEDENENADVLLIFFFWFFCHCALPPSHRRRWVPHRWINRNNRRGRCRRKANSSNEFVDIVREREKLVFLQPVITITTLQTVITIIIIIIIIIMIIRRGRAEGNAEREREPERERERGKVVTFFFFPQLVTPPPFVGFPASFVC